MTTTTKTPRVPKIGLQQEIKIKANELSELFVKVKPTPHQKQVMQNINQAIFYLLKTMGTKNK